MKLIYLIIFLSTSANAIDKNVFKKCSSVDFCSKLRNNHVNEQLKYRADISLMTKADTIIIPLVNGLNQTLSLEINILDSASARIQIKQPNSNRYEVPLRFVFAKDLVTVPYRVTNMMNQSIAFHHRYVEDFAIYVVNGPPFRVEVYRGGNLELLINTERLTMENTEKSQAYAFSVEFEEAEKLYGLFDHAYKIALPETADGSMDPFRLKNVDAHGYEVNSPAALYTSVPVIYGHSAKQTSGIFLYNAAEQWVDISYNNSRRPSAYFMVDSGALDMFVFSGPTPKDVVRQFTSLTGTAPLPPLWALGYHQSRIGYSSQEEVKDVVANMVANNFPMDSIHLDGSYSDSSKWYRWNPTSFSNPLEMQQNVSAYNKTIVGLINPLIKAENNYTVYSEAKGQYFVLSSNKSDYKISIQNATFAISDHFWSVGSFYYIREFQYGKFENSTPTFAGIWSDLNEPGTFDDNFENTLPPTALHRLNEEVEIKHRDVHNLYGLMQASTHYYSLFYRDNRKVRPFVLSRSHFPGSQTFAAIWTGDNTASWEHFAISISQCLTGNLLGITFCGADIGGFIGDPSDELLQRWYQGAVWLPFFRGHSSRTSKRREPYLLSKDVQNVVRAAIELRYRHIPYLYTVFYEHFVTGDPVLRPLFYDYPGLHEHDTQMLIGDGIMAVAVTEKLAKSVKVLFPGTETDIWYRIGNESLWKSYIGGTTIDIPVDINSSPVFYKGGSLVVRQDEVKLSTKDMWISPYTVYINLDKDNRAKGRFYVDDYASFDYRNQQEYFYCDLKFENGRLNITKINGNSNKFNPSLSKVVVHSLTKEQLDGSLEVNESIYTRSSEGKPLESFNINSDTVITL